RSDGYGRHVYHWVLFDLLMQLLDVVGGSPRNDRRADGHLLVQFLGEIVDVEGENEEKAEDEQGDGDGADRRKGHPRVAPETFEGLPRMPKHRVNLHNRIPPAPRRGRSRRSRWR